MLQGAFCGALIVLTFCAVKDAPLLVLPSLKGVFKGFEEPANQDAFMNRFRHILDFWCCRLVKKGEDGGLAYNTFFLSSDW